MEEIKKIEVQGQQYGVADMLMRGVMGGNAQVIEWSHTHNMNDYKDAGTYRIKGERTGNIMTDNLPIMNSGSGNSIDGVLMVMDSTLSDENTDDNFNVCITQFLMLSNRVGGQEGDMYMRSGYGATKDNLTWKAWEKYQTNMEVGCVSDYMLINPQDWTRIGDVGMLSFMDNGIYSGIYIPPKAVLGTPDIGDVVDKDDNAIETFVMIVINNYLAAKDAKRVTQIKFSVTNGGVFSIEKRERIPGISLGTWEPINCGDKWEKDENNDNKLVFYKDGTKAIVIGTSTNIGNNVSIEKGAVIGKNVQMGLNESVRYFRLGTSADGSESHIPYGLNAKNVTWNHESNANTFTTQGYYLITGERTGENDNLPLSKNTLGPGHTLRMVLTVLDSSLPNVGNDSKDCCITQILQCSNRTGGDGNVYVRTASGATKESLVWEPWGKLQTNVEFNGLMDNAKTVDPVTFSKISDIGMFDLVDNGIYSGVYAPPKSLLGSEIYSPSDIGDPTAFETFVMVVINNYAAAGDARVVTQIKFAVSNGGVFSMEKRNSHIGADTFDSYTSWTEWESIGTGVRIDANILIKRDGDKGIKIEYGNGNIIAIGTDGHDFNDNIPLISLGTNIHITDGVCIGTGFDGDTSAVALKVQVNEAGDKVIFSYNGKTAELTLS